METGASDGGILSDHSPRNEPNGSQFVATEAVGRSSSCDPGFGRQASLKSFVDLSPLFAVNQRYAVMPPSDTKIAPVV
jgi:hypothetical protein